ncbi:MAG TPA: Ig-like domain-containing protein, partial [Gaiellaceae bacterium]|nr:Ig-like domain-containing protein [Gaiellaceae bacterium]
GAGRAPAPLAADAAAAQAAVYYVDSASGADANTGLSPANAWKTLSRASSAALGAGDQVLLARGATWTGQLTITANGTPESPIVVGAYGTGALPVIEGGANCIVVSGAHVTVREVHVRGCRFAGIALAGTDDRIENSLATDNVAGVYVRPGTTGAAVVWNELRNNNRMSVNTASRRNDDSGAFGVLLRGDGAEVAYNTISGSDAFSYDYGRDGAAVEIFDGKGNTIHHNLALESNSFTELAGARAADNVYAHNVFRSSLPKAMFLVTRGAGDGTGPVLGTRLYHNTAYLTGSASRGFVCYAGCSSGVLTMRNNIVRAVSKVGYADAPFDEDYDLFYGGAMQFTKGTHSIVANPQFVNAAGGDLRLRTGSPAIDAGVDVGYRVDFDERQRPTDGNGDGRSIVDIGAYEFERPASSDTTAPTVTVTAPAARSIVSGTIMLGADAADDVGVATAKWYVDGVEVGWDGAGPSWSVPWDSSTVADGTHRIFAKASDAAGNWGTSATVTFSVRNAAGADDQAPTAPTSLAVTAKTETSVSIVWSASTDNLGVAGYGLYRDATSVDATAGTTYTFGGLSCGNAYTFVVDAFDAAGNRSPQTSVTATTDACPADTQPPTVTVTAPGAGTTVSGVVTLAADATDNTALREAKWYVDGDEVAWDGSGPPWAHTWDSATVENGSHRIFAKASDAAGNWGTSRVLVFAVSNSATDETAPSAATGFAATARTASGIATTWSASTDNVGVAGYDVYVSGTKLETTTSTSYTFSGLACGTSYTFAVVVFDAAGNRSAPSELVASTEACPADTQPPVATVTAPAEGSTVSGSVTLTADATDDVGVTQVTWFVDGLEVASSGSGPPWTAVWDSTVAANGTHRVLARAADAAGNWTTSAAVTFGVLNGSPPPSEVVLVAAGDVACEPANAPTASTCRQQFTAALITSINPTYVLNLGDAQYEFGSLDKFSGSYDRSWGRFKDKTWVTAGGSHDFYGGGDFYTYFGTRAGPEPFKTWFSFDVGGWHVISLNAQCSNANVGGCGSGSPQEVWLRNDLAAHTNACTLAMWHNARWSSGPRHGTDPRTDAFVRDLYDAGAEIVLSGHDHDYERFAPQNPTGARDDARGLLQFVVGTGGKSLESSWGAIRPNSLVRDRVTYGVLKLTLRPDGYDFEFVPEAGKTFRDLGSGTCH